MKKCLLLLAVLLLALPFAGCAERAVLDETYIYEAETVIRALDVRIGAADFTVQYADKFAVESNLKYLSISEQDGVLHIVDEKTVGVTYKTPVLTLCIPEDAVLERVDIAAGAGKMMVDRLSAQTLKLQLGAGDVTISNLYVESSAEIHGGAGKITIANGTIRNLQLEMGVGELDFTAALRGDSSFSLGVGKTSLALIGSLKDYKVDIEEGLGSISVDGKTVTDFGSSGSGETLVRIHGGIGAVDLTFQQSASA